MTSLFGLCHGLAMGIALWAVNGVGLALVVPNTQSLTADAHAATARGAAFGLLQAMAQLGAMLGSLFATSIGARLICLCTALSHVRDFLGGAYVHQARTAALSRPPIHTHTLQSPTPIRS